jgi:hypothetical protein
MLLHWEAINQKIKNSSFFCCFINKCPAASNFTLLQILLLQSAFIVLQLEPIYRCWEIRSNKILEAG